VKRILGATITIANGVGELRNRYGTGHRRHRQLQGLGPRPARLAVHAAITWCLLMIDTLQDPAAPWRRSDSAP
jgi:Abortive infection C-terminus